MLVFQSDVDLTNPKLPAFTIAQQEIDILKLQPTAWIETTSGVVSNDGVKANMVRDKTGKTRWVPGGTQLPALGKSNGVDILKFGLTGPVNSGYLAAENSYESFPANGVYTLAVVFRVPPRNVAPYAGTGGNMVGNRAAPPDALRVRLAADSYDNDAVWLNHGAYSPVNNTTYPINTTKSGFRDNLWHTAYIEVSELAHTWEWDGAVLQTRTTPAAPFATALARQMLIGSSGNPPAVGFIGDIAALLLIPSVLSAESKALVYNRINAIKATL